MRITFQSQGGIAFFPKLNQPVVIESDQLPAEQQVKLEGLLKATRFFALPTSVGERKKGAADMREYTLRVEDGAQDHTIHVTEPFENSQLEQLIAELRTHARKAVSPQGQNPR
jgi:hypothetical protein